MKAIVLVDHGSRQRAANEVVEKMAELVRSAAPETRVYPAHMELAEPSLGVALAQAVSEGATDVIVVPYMLAPGRHAAEDIPKAVACEAAAHPTVNMRVSAPLGVHPSLAQVVLDRVEESTSTFETAVATANSET